MPEFRAMDRTGDGLKLQWDAGNDTQVTEARRMFNDYRGRNFDMFEYDPNAANERGRRLQEFAPNLRGVLAVPRMTGG